MTEPFDSAYRTAQLDQGRAAIDHSIDDLVEGAKLLLDGGIDPNDVMLSVYDVAVSDPEMSCWVVAGAILRLASR